MQKMSSLQPRQVQILEFIQTYPYAYPPSVREICKGVGLRSTATVQHHLEVLKRDGYINRVKTQARGITIITPGEEIV